MSTLISPLRRARQVAAEDTAVVCGRTRFTYEQTWERCRRLAGALSALGLVAGDRVAIAGPNCHRYLEIYQAVPGSGLALVPLNVRHATAELRYALADSGTRVLFTSLEPEGLADLVEHVFDLDAGYEALLAAADPVDFPADLPAQTLAGLFYTGGTTGASKGVMLTHGNLIANALHTPSICPIDAHTRWLLAAPLFHAAGSVAVLTMVWNAGRHVILPTFAPGPALDLIATEGVTVTLLVPTMLAALAEEQDARPRDVSTLKLISHGGAPIATETLRRAHAAFPAVELVHVYGATETAPISVAMRHEERMIEGPRGRSCGQPVVGVEVVVVGLDGTVLPAGEVGELAVRGENVMAGYWRKPEQTAAALSGGWYRSGDLGYQDERGFVFLVDRAKDMIITGGENVYSTEVEEVLFAHPAVEEACVFGIPDPRWGEAVHAVVVPRGPVAIDDLLAHCRTAIAPYKVPKTIELREQPLPKSGAGKVLKRELRAPHWSGERAAIAGS
jgi:long-chain acyl-CoA synthetase